MMQAQTWDGKGGQVRVTVDTSTMSNKLLFPKGGEQNPTPVSRAFR